MLTLVPGMTELCNYLRTETFPRNRAKEEGQVHQLVVGVEGGTEGIIWLASLEMSMSKVSSKYETQCTTYPEANSPLALNT